MPAVSEFYGIKIHMHIVDHSPPHFHAMYGGEEALFEIASGKILNGKLPERALNLVRDWAEQHRAELEENWQVARARQELFPITPL